tara:strand:- start:25 stop:201 length:177 start_codon:yes stop_codon:yes gene_type:complete
MEENVKTIYWYLDKFKELEKLEKETSNNFALGSKFREYMRCLKTGEVFDWSKEHTLNG